MSVEHVREQPPIPQKDGDPIWQQDFPINRASELNNSRRQFLKFLGLTSFAFFTGTLGVALKALLEQQRTTELQPMRIAAAPQVPVGSSYSFYYPDQSYPAILVHLADTGSPAADWVAYERKCTHLLCPVLYQPDKGETPKGRLYCPCHDGEFDVASGRNTAGPPPRPLNRITLEIRSDGVYAVGREGA